MEEKTLIPQSDLVTAYSADGDTAHAAFQHLFPQASLAPLRSVKNKEESSGPTSLSTKSG